MDSDLRQRLLRAIIDDRLVVFCGAGLSMAPPSRVPSAERLAQECGAQYRARYGSACDSLPTAAENDLDALTTHFYARGELQSVFIDQLFHHSIRPFVRDPNEGHYAIADFLACGAVRFVVSTNVDVLIELAASDLGERKPEVAIQLAEVARVRDHRPHMKLHGCISRNSAETLWCTDQLSDPPFSNRIDEFHGWLPGELMGRVLVFVGFWSDWAYLNDVFQRAITDLEPSSIILVNPSAESVLAEKAPELWKWAHGTGVEFNHVQASGASFLAELRSAYSDWYVRRVFDSASQAYPKLKGKQAPDFTSAVPEDNEELYSMRRDLSGTLNEDPVRTKLPTDQMELVGLCHLQLIERGAVREGSRYVLNENRIRVVSGAGRLLSSVREKYMAETPRRVSDSVVVCVGARDDGHAAANVVRPEPEGNIVRPLSFARWITDADLDEL